MNFYISTFILALIQTFLLLPVFSGYLYTPDFVTVAILYALLKDQDTNPKRVLIPAFVLDLLYDSIGLNISSKLLVFFSTIAFKRKYIITTKGALILLSTIVFVIEHTFKYLLFRIKYYYPFEPTSLMLCLIFQTVAMVILSRRIITQNEQT